MTDLLKPRYKVIAYYPGSPFEIGEVLELSTLPPYTNGNGDKELNLYGNENDAVPEEDVIEAHTVFRKLEWWEERKPEEMPEYVENRFTNVIDKVLVHFKDDVAICETLKHEFAYHRIIPSTESDYNNYIKQKI